MAAGPPGRPLIAETGGINAMVVDSTALPEQAVRDVVASAFRSAGQRCSALRVLVVQEDVAEGLLAMLRGAMDELRLGDPWDLATDVGPVIDRAARDAVLAHVAQARAEGRVLHELAPPEGTFVGPAIIRVGSVGEVTREVFGPVLHVATFRAADLPAVLAEVNATGYGLTFGFHSRIDDRVRQVVGTVRAGNVYVNRNQIGAVVGSQPFGGEGLSGTGPKAGGPRYLPRFGGASAPDAPEEMPGPTGESNRLTLHRRGPILCLGPDVVAQADAVRALGGLPVTGDLDPENPPAAVLWWGDDAAARGYERALADLDGPIVPLLTGRPDVAHVMAERHVCIDTTAAGGNATLLAEAGT